MRLIIGVIAGFILLSCHHKSEAIGHAKVTIFKDTNLYFDMALKNDSLKLDEDIIRLDAGRVLLKKVVLPKYNIQPKVLVNVSLTSNGDPWDKSGSLFVIPKSTDLSIINFDRDSILKSHINEDFPGIEQSLINDRLFMPNVELLRFMTPFGIGHFNSDERVEALKPVYIPKWEERVFWSEDITQLLPLLEDEVYIGVFIDTWTKSGYNISVELDFIESDIPNHEKQQTHVIPLVNTTKYVSHQGYFDAFSNGSLKTVFNLDKTVANAKLYYITTGHGGHKDGDEFTKKENLIKLNGRLLKQYIPWRDDCAAFRRFNPTSGVWTETTMWNGKEIEERIASSDYSRSNWCPGSAVEPEVLELGILNEGKHELEIAIPEAQAIDGDKINYWMVSAYLVYEE